MSGSATGRNGKGPVRTAHVIHDRELVASSLRFRNAVFRPTRMLQRLLIAGILVALGFIVPPGTVRSGVWTAAVLMLIWMIIGDAVITQIQWIRDPFRRAGVPEVLEFTGKGIERLGLPGEGAGAGPAAGGAGASGTGSGADRGTEHIPYEHVARVLRDEACWYVVLRDRGLIIIDRQDLEGGIADPEAFTRFLAARTRQDVEVLDTSLAETMRRVQGARRDYLDSRKGKGILGGLGTKGGAAGAGDAAGAGGTAWVRAMLRVRGMP